MMAKRIVLALLGCVLLGFLYDRLIEKNPHYSEVIERVKSDARVIDRTGPVSSAKVVRVTNAAATLTTAGEYTPAFDLFNVAVEGKKASARVVVERSDAQAGKGSKFSIRSID